MRKIISIVMMIVAILATSLLASATESTGQLQDIGEFLQADQANYIGKVNRLVDSDPVVLAAGSEFNDFPIFEEDVTSAEHRSVGRAFIYSMAVPGLGEYYVGSKLKAGLFFAFDIFNWSQYMLNHKKGSEKEDEFRTYADEHWSPTKYMVWLVENEGVTIDTVGTDKLPNMKTQQYYEMIGKYDKFQQGWDDADPITGASARRKLYVQMRDEANNKLDAARTWAMISLANRVLSAFDAALSAKRFNKQRDVFSEINVKARLAKYDGEQIPQVMFTYKFF